ncbi:type I restriction enzyme S subunit [Thiogranum longum]|uniref:Type I restriction enzyme S subunit n=1 Tax=Thiogranum longum TaxID=1537524 RepID=A0A4R1HEC1_9GAMM|nr:restriction endonuclease subunit S [Thiogranum longum]TCK18993.1 type I restriction enzyme S subunit [Thiogranum longum]
MSVAAKLPQRWAEATVGDLAEYINGFAFKPAHRTATGLPIIRIQNLTDSTKPYNRTTLDFPEVYKVKNGDLLVSWSATLDAFIWRGEDAWVNQHIFKVVPIKKLFDPGLLYYWMKIAISEMIDTEHLHGSTMKHINRGPFLAHKTYIPPLNEQVRIYNKLEEVFSDLDNGVTELKAAQTKLTQYRQSLLKSAVEGTLTQQWRETHKPKETGTQLLERILIERRKRWEESKLQEFKEKGKKPPKDWQKKYPEPVEPDTSELPELPEGWVWATIDQLAVDKKYGSSSKTNDDSKGVPILRMGNIQDGDIDYTNLKYLPKKHSEFPRLLLNDGDLLFNRTNSAELVGKTAIYRDIGRPCSYASYLISVTFSESYLPDLAAYFINSTLGKAWILSVVNQTAGQANVNGTKLGALAIPLPPIEEQNEIVEKTRQAQEEIKLQLEAVSVSLKQIEAQRKNILKSAFAGELVGQDPNDEPASILLERIKVEREERVNKVKPKRVKKKTSTMPKLNSDSVKDWINSQTKDKFSFEEIRSAVGGDYETLKDVIFSILSESNAPIEQVFDKPEIGIQFKKVGR